VAQGGVCALCLKQMPHPDEARKSALLNAPEAPSIDHVKPRSKGGSNHFSNLLMACRGCNSSRGNSDVTQQMRVARMFVAAKERKARKDKLDEAYKLRLKAARA